MLRRASILCRLGAIDLERADAAAAAERFALALSCDPNSARARSGLLRAAEASGDDKTLFDLYAREATRCDPDRLAELGREAVRPSATSDDPDAAVLAVQRWAERSGSRESQQALVALFEESGRTEELVAALEQLETLLDGTERAANRRRLGYLHAAEGRPGDAIEAWRKALRSDASDPPSLEALAESNRDVELLALCDARASDVLLAPHVEVLRARALERAGRLPEAAGRFRALHASGDVDEESVAELERTARALADTESLVAALSAGAVRAIDPVDRDHGSLERAELLDLNLDRPAEAASAYTASETRASDAATRAAAAQRIEALLERRAALLGVWTTSNGTRWRSCADAEAARVMKQSRPMAMQRMKALPARKSSRCPSGLVPAAPCWRKRHAKALGAPALSGVEPLRHRVSKVHRSVSFRHQHRDAASLAHPDTRMLSE